MLVGAFHLDRRFWFYVFKSLLFSKIKRLNVIFNNRRPLKLSLKVYSRNHTKRKIKKKKEMMLSLKKANHFEWLKGIYFFFISKKNINNKNKCFAFVILAFPKRKTAVSVDSFCKLCSKNFDCLRSLFSLSLILKIWYWYTQTRHKIYNCGQANVFFLRQWV